jgi:hypothetical protein
MVCLKSLTTTYHSDTMTLLGSGPAPETRDYFFNGRFKMKAVLDRAPLPKRGIIRAVVETVQGLGGATEQQVYKYLPASILKSDQVITHKKLKSALISGVYRGYLVHDPKLNQYKLAPMSYFQERCKYFDTLPSSKGRAENHRPQVRMEPVKFEDRYEGIVIHIPASAVPFALGLIAGVAATVMFFTLSVLT